MVINPSKGRRYVVGDVHGHAQTLRTLIMDQFRLTSDDQLFLLGDYIDRGEDNAGVLDFILELAENGYQVFPLRGNHEEMLLDAWHTFKSKSKSLFSSPFFNTEATDLLDKQGNVHMRYLQFLESLPYYYQLDDFYLVHAGFNFSATHPFEDYESMLWMRHFKQNPTGKTIIHGHQITDLAEIKRRVSEKSPIIPLDNGCYYASAIRSILKNRPVIEVGNLCGLELNTFQLFVQKNIG